MNDGGVAEPTRQPLAIRRYGAAPEAGGHAYLLIHGFGGSSFTWRGWAPALGALGTTYTVDLTGFGDAPKPGKGPYDLPTQADRIVAFARDRHLGAMTLIGHSMGGGVALLLATRLLDRPSVDVRALVLVAAAAYPQRLPPFVGLSRHPRLTRGLAKSIGVRRIVKTTLRSIVHDPSSVDDAQVDAYTAPLESEGGLEAAMATGRSIVPPDLDEITAKYPRLTMPTLALWGDADRVVPLWVGQRLARELPRAELHVLEACGHVPSEERPDASLAVLLDFLERYELAPPTRRNP